MVVTTSRYSRYSFQWVSERRGYCIDANLLDIRIEALERELVQRQDVVNRALQAPSRRAQTLYIYTDILHF
jgi:hypothetical protein